jgi:hypothetical protein
VQRLAPRAHFVFGRPYPVGNLQGIPTANECRTRARLRRRDVAMPIERSKAACRLRPA